MLYAKPVIPPNGPPGPLDCPRCMPVVLQPGQPARPGPANWGRPPRWWGLPLAFTCLQPVSVRRYLPQLPPMPSLPTLIVRSWGTLPPVLRPRRYPYSPYPLLSSFPPPSSLLSVQDEQEGCQELTQVIVLHRPESSSATSSPHAFALLDGIFPLVRATETDFPQTNDAIHHEGRRPRELERHSSRHVKHHI